jgi:peptidoglycan hydrolase CwlO-like protein
MSTDTNRLGERVASVETGVEQLNKRVGALEGRVNTLDERMTTRFDRLDTKIEHVDGRIDERVDQLEYRMRRWLVFVVLATTLLTSIVFGLLQVIL